MSRLWQLATLTVVAAQDSGACASNDFAWCNQPYYYASLPSSGTSSCCGSQLIGNPSLNDAGFKCPCDVTAGACDEGCCCDLDCSSDSLRLGGVFGCTSNGTVESTAGYTLCSDNLISTNLPAAVVEQGLVQAFGGADGLLCIVADNSPLRGNFFQDPVATAPLTERDVQVEIDGALPLQYGTWLDAPVLIQPASYAIGAPILGDGCIGGGSAGCSKVAPVKIPASGADGACTGAQELPFLQDVAPFTCALDPSATLAELCATTLNATFLRNANFKPAPAATSTADLTLMLYDANASAAEAYSSASEAPMSYYDSLSNTCYNALTKLELKIQSGGSGVLTGVTAYLTTDAVNAVDLAGLKVGYGAAYTYVEEGTVRATSGRPGYIRGLPVLLAEGTSVRTGGLKLLPRTPTGTCASGHQGSSPVLFGEDLAVSCVERLTAAELEAKCTAATPIASQEAFASLNVTEELTKVGVYGDSHPTLTDDWVDLHLRYPNNDATRLTPSWNPSTYECANMLTGIHLRVLYTEVGATANPISKIVGAELHFTARTIAAARGPLGTPATTALTLTATTTFARLDAQSFDFVPEAPTIIPPLPYDFFYPFTSAYQQGA